MSGALKPWSTPMTNLADELDAAHDRIAQLERELAEARGEKCAHGWKGTKPDDGERIRDRCPACGMDTLFIGSGGWLTCGNLSCKDPAVTDAYKAKVEQAQSDLAQARAELEAVRRERDDARSDAVCHCGALMHEHTLSDNHVAKPMERRCPNEACISRLEGVRDRLLDTMKLGHHAICGHHHDQTHYCRAPLLRDELAAALGDKGMG